MKRKPCRTFRKTRGGLGNTGGDEFDDGAATVGEDVVEEDDACGVPGSDSLRLSLEVEEAEEMTRSGWCDVDHGGGATERFGGGLRW